MDTITTTSNALPDRARLRFRLSFRRLGLVFRMLQCSYTYIGVTHVASFSGIGFAVSVSVWGLAFPISQVYVYV